MTKFWITTITIIKKHLPMFIHYVNYISPNYNIKKVFHCDNVSGNLLPSHFVTTIENRSHFVYSLQCFIPWVDVYSIVTRDYKKSTNAENYCIHWNSTVESGIIWNLKPTYYVRAKFSYWLLLFLIKSISYSKYFRYKPNECLVNFTFY